MRHFQRKKMFLKLVTTYSLIIVGIFLMFALTFYSLFGNSIRNQISKINYTVLSKSVEWIDFELMQLENSASLAVDDQSIDSFCNITYGDSVLTPAELSVTQNISHKLQNTFLTTDFIKNAYLYSYRSDGVITSDGFVENASNTRDAGWLSIINDRDYMKAWFPRRMDTGGNAITLIRQLPMFTYDPKAAVILNVEESKIVGVLQDNINIPGSQLIVLADDGTVVSHPDKNNIAKKAGELSDTVSQSLLKKTESQEFNYKMPWGNAVVLQYISDYTGWRYYLIVPQEKFLANMYRMNSIMWVLCLLIIILGIYIVNRTSKKIYSPVRKIMNMLTHVASGEGKNQTGDEMAYIFDAIEHLNNEQYRLSRVFLQNRQTLKESFVKNLVTGEIMNKKQIEERGRDIDIAFQYPSFGVCLAQIDQYDEFCKENNVYDRKILKYGIVNILEELIGEKHMVIGCDFDEDYVLVLINYRPGEEEISGIFMNAQRLIEDNLNISLTIADGGCVDALENVWQSYRRAMIALNYRFIQGYGKIIRYKDIQAREEGDYSDIGDFIPKISNIIRMKDDPAWGQLEPQLLDALKAQNVLRVSNMKAMLANIVKTVAADNAVKIEGLEMLLQQAGHIELAEDVTQWINDVFEVVSGESEQADSGGAKQKYFSNIIKCVNENYQKDISLEWVSERVGISPQYVSTLFKQEYGQTFLHYLNKIRVEAAKELIKTEDDSVTVNKIGEMVGFNNMHSFMRVFKKYEGITPGKYREMMRQ